LQVLTILNSVVDLHHIGSDPDSTYLPDADPDADPDSTYHPDEDPDLDPDCQIKARTHEKVLKYRLIFRTF
jgi:hypothetical protein